MLHVNVSSVSRWEYSSTVVFADSFRDISLMTTLISLSSALREALQIRCENSREADRFSRYCSALSSVFKDTRRFIVKRVARFVNENTCERRKGPSFSANFRRKEFKFRDCLPIRLCGIPFSVRCFVSCLIRLLRVTCLVTIALIRERSTRYF